MRRNQAHSIWFGVAIFGVLALPALFGQNSKPEETGVASDWSHHHLIFSRPATPEQARRLEQDPRYRQQLLRSQARIESSDAGAVARRHPRRLATRPDWSEDLGANTNVGADIYPAKFSFKLSTANCDNAPQPDFVVYPTELKGSNIQANLIAYDNLYSGCPGPGPVPSVYWAYNTGTGAKILTSPSFSRDGTQVAFVQTIFFGPTPVQSSLVLLKWLQSPTDTVITPETLTALPPLLYTTCVAPCVTTIPLTDSSLPATDSASSVFLDLSSDTAWVGDDTGMLHKFSPVFLGTPAEVTTGGFPAPVSATGALTNAVHDFLSGNVYVADSSGFLYAVDSSTGASTQSGQLDFGAGISFGPVVDSTAELVYVFASSDGSVNCAGGAACAAVHVLSTNFIFGDPGTEAIVGTSTIPPALPNPLYIGGFDSTYENSINATGNLYVCGNTGATPTLYQVAISGGVFGTVTTGPEVSNAVNPPCSPVSDIYNPNTPGGATEFFFVSTSVAGVSAGCHAGGCVFNFNDTPWKPSTAYVIGQEVVDSNFQIQVATQAGTSGLTPPIWSTALGNSTTDGGVLWVDQGLTATITPQPWAPSTAYSLGTKIVDDNRNIELVTTAGTSDVGPPLFNVFAGGMTTDNTVVWANLGQIATSSAAESNGTSGIIIDNTVSSATISGASQIYFFTLGNQTCGASPLVSRCAVQASQSALQ